MADSDKKRSHRRSKSEKPVALVSIKIYEDRDVTRIDILEPELTGQAEINDFVRRVAKGVTKLGHHRIVINCENVNSISSRMLGVLLEMDRKLKAKKAQLRLANLSDPVREVMLVTRLHDYLSIHDSVDAAYASFE